MRPKSELYPKEQEEIIQKIIDILELDEQNSVTLHELDNNQEKQQKILDLLPDIRKYFTYSSNGVLMYPDKSRRVYLTIIKQITTQKYNIINKEIMIKGLRTRRYIFELKT